MIPLRQRMLYELQRHNSSLAQLPSSRDRRIIGKRSFTLWPTLRERSLLIKMLSESRTVYQRLADGTARKRSVEDSSDEKSCAQHSHDDGEVMQAVVGRVLTVHETEKTG
jgi:hypothetical protein